MRIDRVSVFPILLAFAAFAQEAAPSADEVINKSIEARGGADRLKAVKTTRMTGKMVLMGGQMEAPFTMEVKRPSSVLMSLNIQDKKMVRAFDGTTAWTINPFQGGDDAQKMSEDEAKDMAENADVDGPLVDYKAKGHTVELVGKEDVGGVPAYKLKINKKSGKTDYIYLDAKTYLPIKSTVRASVQGTQTEVESYPSNYKPVNGVMIPFAVEQKMNGQTMMQMTIDKVEPNAPLDDATFRMPVKQEKPNKDTKEAK
jgi:outer membrane lipoprotein-sorting protein